MCLKVSPFQAYFNALLSTAATVAAAAGASTEQTNKHGTCLKTVALNEF